MDVIDGKIVFTNTNENLISSTTECFSMDNMHGVNPQGSSTFSPLAAPFQSRIHTSENDFIPLPAQQESLIADTDGNRTDTSSVPNSTLWNDDGANVPDNADMVDSFEELLKGLSTANYYVSSLSREQASVLRGIRPNILYEFLSEIARVRTARKMRRALPNECAFCKNNGENEENYSSHALKDWRGRVLCPVLRAFRCPRCGATGDRAHTIKYCPENFDTGLQRSDSLLSRRRSSTSLTLGTPRGAGSTPATPAPSPNVSNTPFTTIWSTFGIN